MEKICSNYIQILYLRKENKLYLIGDLNMSITKSFKEKTKRFFKNYSEAASKYGEAMALLYTIDTKK